MASLPVGGAGYSLNWADRGFIRTDEELGLGTSLLPRDAVAEGSSKAPEKSCMQAALEIKGPFERATDNEDWQLAWGKAGFASLGGLIGCAAFIGNPHPTAGSLASVIVGEDIGYLLGAIMEKGPSAILDREKLVNNLLGCLKVSAVAAAFSYAAPLPGPDDALSRLGVMGRIAGFDGPARFAASILINLALYAYDRQHNPDKANQNLKERMYDDLRTGWKVSLCGVGWQAGYYIAAAVGSAIGLPMVGWPALLSAITIYPCAALFYKLGAVTWDYPIMGLWNRVIKPCGEGIGSCVSACFARCCSKPKPKEQKPLIVLPEMGYGALGDRVIPITPMTTPAHAV